MHKKYGIVNVDDDSFGIPYFTFKLFMQKKL